MSGVLDEVRRRHDRRDDSAREWRAAGGSVLAYMCDNFPEELVAAAGLLPFRLGGDPGAPAPQVARYVAPDRHPMVRVPRFVDAMLEPVVSGAQEFVDYVVVPHGRKAVEACYESLSRAPAAGAPMPDIRLFYLDKSHVPGYSESVFDHHCLLSFKAQLEEWCAAPVTDDALADAIAEANRGRALLARMNRLRVSDPPRLSGTDAAMVYVLAGAMPRAAHNDLVQRLVDDAASLPARPGRRIYLAGSPHPTPRLYRLVESLGATIVGEDHCWGARIAGCPVPVTPSPMEGLADRYHQRPVCSIEFPLDRALDRWQANVRLARPDGVLVYVVDGDELHIWDTPDRLERLAHDGVPSLHLARQRPADDVKLRDRIGAWLTELPISP
jgi:benzoyl-CoA reductase/2-hydroxyglutaryl-CoA dehydratase subunit BcrC/BadD/HgdB